MGGDRITLGSDAHTAEGVGDGILESASMLCEMGFENITLFCENGEKQIPIAQILQN